jgi:hypothetical protein
VLYFFAGENPVLWQLLNTVTRDRLTMRHDEPGRWWASDACRTAWTLYVRYLHTADDQWALKWQYQDSWREWLKPANPE